MKIDHQDFASQIEEFKLESLADDPHLLFDQWYQRAEKILQNDSSLNGIVLATVDSNNRPRSRWLFLRGYDSNGYYFYTNYQSSKGIEINEKPWASLVMYWPKFYQQIRIEGKCLKVSPEESNRYFSSRPFLSQASAASSQQSQPLDSREELLNRASSIADHYRTEEQVPRPEQWGGYKIVPDFFEFWQGRENRLHERVTYQLHTSDDQQWNKQLLQP